MKRYLIFALVAMLVISAPVTIGQDEDVSEQTIVLTFIPNIQYAPFYVALERGYFAEHGLDVSYEYLEEPVIVDLVAAGEEQIGVVSGEQVILARASNRPVVYVYEWYQEYPVGIVYPPESGIETVMDLAGREVGLPGRFGATYIALTTLLRGSNLTEEDIQLEEIGFSAPEVLCRGDVEAAVVYFNNEPLQIRNRIQDDECNAVESVDVIPVSAVSNLVSNGIITSEEIAANDPDLVTGVVEGFDRALREAIRNPARAYLLSLDHVENLPGDDEFVAALETLADERDTFLATEPDQEAIDESRDAMLETLSETFSGETLIQFEILLETIKLWDAEQLGHSDVESWDAMQETLLEMGLIEAPIALEDAFTNRFLPQEDR